MTRENELLTPKYGFGLGVMDGQQFLDVGQPMSQVELVAVKKMFTPLEPLELGTIKNEGFKIPNIWVIIPKNLGYGFPWYVWPWQTFCVSKCQKLLASGFNVSVGGGLGFTHNNQKTHPRLADVIGALDSICQKSACFHHFFRDLLKSSYWATFFFCQFSDLEVEKKSEVKVAGGGGKTSRQGFCKPGDAPLGSR